MKSAILSALFALIIGSFWVLGSLQEPVFYHMVGRAYHPQVNVISFLLILPFLLTYLFFLGHVRKHRLFIACVGFYALFFGVSSVLLSHPSIGLANTALDAHRLLGWCIYAVTKTYGSVLVTIFWSFATSLTSMSDAKRTFPLIFFCGQLGSLGGSSLVRWGAGCGMPLLYGIAVACMVLIMVLIEYLHTHFPLVRSVEAPSRSGMWEGLRLLISRAQLRGIFVVSTAFLIITAFVDYQMHFLAHASYPTVEAFAVFKGWYGQIVNLFTLIFSLGITKVLLAGLGVRGALLLYPAITGFLVTLVFFYPTFWPLVCAMVLLRGLSFALNNPAKEMLYINQGSDVRFKTKGWIDMIGYRLAFAFGSQLTYLFSGSFADVVLYGALVSFGVIGVWLHSIGVIFSGEKEVG